MRLMNVPEQLLLSDALFMRCSIKARLRNPCALLNFENGAGSQQEAFATPSVTTYNANTNTHNCRKFPVLTSHRMRSFKPYPDEQWKAGRHECAKSSLGTNRIAVVVDPADILQALQWEPANVTRASPLRSDPINFEP